MSPIKAAADLSAGCQIVLAGSPLDDSLASRIMELRVETTVGLPDVCTIRLAESDPRSSGTLTVIDHASLVLGATLVVKLATAIRGQLSEVFNGEITTLEAELGSSTAGDPVLELTVTALDKSHRMHRKTTTRTLRQVTVTDVARKMASENGLAVGQLADLPGGAAQERHQVGETDWEFLSRLVHAHGGELDVASGKLHVNDPSKTKSPVGTLVYGDNLQRFRPRLSSVGQVATVNVRGWDVKRKAAATGAGTPKGATDVQGSSVNGAVNGSSTLIATAFVSNEAEAKARAKAAAMQLGHERVQGSAVATGDPKLLAGEFVEVSGVGQRFAGTHRIVSAVHSYGVRGYVTQLTLGAGGRPLAETVGSGRGRAFADHLVIGIVTDNNDPDKLGRAKIRYPLLNDEVESGWARIAWGAAGAARGTVTLPHVNDEVAVGFEHGDVRRPVILGALFNGVDTPGDDLLKASSSLASRFPRDLDVGTQKKVILASGTGISVKTDNGPVEVTSGGDLKLTTSAAGTITIETNGKITAKGQQGIEINSTAQVKITGTAGVTVESTGPLQLKGSAIQVQATGILQLSGATVMLG